MKLATARYYNPNVPTCGLLPVGFTNGYPRFLKYKLAANLRQLAPDPKTIHMTDQVAFDRIYRQRLDALSIATVEQLLEDLALQNAAEGLVLCCFEDLRTGRFCHRQTFGRWFCEQTGKLVPELPEPGQQGLQL